MKRHIRLVTLLLAISFVHTAQAQYSTTLRGMLNAFERLAESNCPVIDARVAEARKDPKAPPVGTLRVSRDTVCVCMPEKTRALLEQLSDGQLSKQVSEEEFLAVAKPGIVDKCAAEALRAMYSPQVCTDVYKATGSKVRVNVDSYCLCMLEAVSKYSEAESAAIGLAAADYIPRAARAKNAGEPEPPRPPEMTRMAIDESACKARSAAP